MVNINYILHSVCTLEPMGNRPPEVYFFDLVGGLINILGIFGYIGLKEPLIITRLQAHLFVLSSLPISNWSPLVLMLN